ncbi:MAG: hypothetical protein ACLFUM_04325 [Spirochaetaceae bacterium]
MSELPRESSWFSDEGPEQDVVMSTRVRLARNVVGYRFPPYMAPTEREELERALAEYFADRDGEFVRIGADDDSARGLLTERNFLSPEVPSGAGPLFLRQDEHIAVQVNHIDHLRIMSYRAGLDPRRSLADAEELDDALEDEFPFSVSLEWGYLTARLDDLGTGLRVSSMLHLPGLRQMGLLDEALGIAWKDGFSVRGFAVDGTESLGDVYLIVSRESLGLAEKELVEKLERVTSQLVHYERQVRETLLGSRKGETEDAVYRAMGILAYSRCLSRTETFRLLSWLRLGVALGMAREITLAQATSLFFLTQRSHVVDLLAAEGMADTQENEDEQRAVLLRRYLESRR